MASNVAKRRAAKTARRRQLSRTRRAAAPVSLADRTRHFARGAIVHCLVQPEMFQTGIGTVLFARKAATGELATAIFLVDAFSIGVKDVLFDVMERSEVEFYISTMRLAAPWQQVAPSYARKLLRDTVAYAATLGMRPHRGFASIEALFGDVRAEDCAETFVFGHDGRPLYVAGPTETREQITRRLGRMVERLGPDGLDFVVPISEEEAIVSPGMDAAWITGD